jgi:hypothetical protein
MRFPLERTSYVDFVAIAALKTGARLQHGDLNRKRIGNGRSSIDSRKGLTATRVIIIRTE